MKRISELLEFIFSGRKSTLYYEFEGWLKQSRRFQSFALEYQSKIRAKLKNAPEAGRLKDLRAELQVAFVLLSSDKLAVEYEIYASSKQRGPDFTVTFKVHSPFNVEVRRLPNLPPSKDARTIKLMTVLCEKCKQLPPSMPTLFGSPPRSRLKRNYWMRSLAFGHKPSKRRRIFLSSTGIKVQRIS